MNWSQIDFGKHTGKTLPQIICKDPDWFYWAVENVFASKSKELKEEVTLLYKRSCRIRIPKNEKGSLVVDYFVNPMASHKFDHFEIVNSNQVDNASTSACLRRAYLDMSVPRKIASYDKLGCRNLLVSFRYHFFNDRPMTKKKVEAFFADEGNFHAWKAGI